MRSIAICWKAQLILYLQRRRWEQSSADPRCGSSSVSRWCTCLSHKRLSRNHHTTKKTGCHARITGRIQPFCLSSRKFLSTSSSRRTTQRHRDDKRSFYPHHLCRWRQIILHWWYQADVWLSIVRSPKNERRNWKANVVLNYVLEKVGYKMKRPH